MADGEDIEDSLASGSLSGHDLCAGHEIGTLHEASPEVGVLRTTYRHSHHMPHSGRDEDSSFR